MKCVRVEIRVEKCTLLSELEVSLDSFYSSTPLFFPFAIQAVFRTV